MIITRRNIFFIGKAVLILLWLCNLGACKSTKTVATSNTNTQIEAKRNIMDSRVKGNYISQNDKKQKIGETINANDSSRSESFSVGNKKSLIITGPDSIDYFINRPNHIPSILTKVFPGVEFYYRTAAVTNTSPRLMCNYKGAEYNPLLAFDVLLDLVKYNQIITLEDKLLALLTIKEGFATNIQIINKSDCSLKIHQKLSPFNTKLEALINGKSETYILLILQNKIYFFANEKDGKYNILQLDTLPNNNN